MIQSTASTTEPAPRRTAPWAIVLGVWTVYGLLITVSQHTSFALSRPEPVPWSTILLIQMPLALGWALLTPFILLLVRRFPFDRRHWLGSTMVHLAACLLIVMLMDLGYAWNYGTLMRGITPNRPLLDRAVNLFVGWGIADATMYVVIVAVAAAVQSQRQAREREVASLQLAAQLAQAELQALKMQLHPHFLFNALHTIGALVRTGDRDNAVRVVAGLGDLLRRVLDDESRQEVPLEQELQFISLYLDIERTRFRDRLTVAVSVDPAAQDAWVPHLILQPVVENAIHHGITASARPAHLLVCARKVGEHLHLVVRDDGPGTTAVAQPGLGLSNTRARLSRLYGEAGALDVTNAPGGGLEARIVLPFHVTPLRGSAA